MKHKWLTGPYALISISAGVICAHAVLNTLFQSHGFTISYLLWSIWALLAALACLWRAFHCPHSIRTHWRLAAASLFFIFIAAIVEAPAEIFSKAVPSVASIGDFFFFASFVPILLAIMLPDEGSFSRSTFLIDSFQAAACTCLAYTVLFGAFPFSGESANAMPYAPLEFVYDAEYLAVVVLAALRLFLGTRSAADRYFFRVILLYTSLYALCSGIYNRYVGKYSLTNGMDALNDIPSAALALAAIFAPAAAFFADTALSPRAWLVRLIDNARPVFLSLALIGLSAMVAVRHFAGAFGFIVGAFVLYSLRASLLQSKLEHAQAALQQSNSQLSEIAHLDSLTGVSNRRGFDQIFSIEWGRALRTRRPLSLLLIDVDHFKRINDTYGHQAGDECLRNTARVLSAVLDRPADLVARYGGDEFAILLAETGSYGASTVAGHIRSAIANDAAQAFIPITLSIGVSTWNAEQDANPDHLIRAADHALYAAKHNGRDRIELIDLHSLAVR